ncbi:MAG: hypothetical protein AAFV07_13130, partial [Bacteroidota bacterium]
MKTLLVSCIRFCLWLSMLGVCQILSGQVADDFSDGDFISNPAWEGDLTEWQVSSGELQSMGPGTSSGTLHLATASTAMSETEWRLYMRYAFAPSTSNQIRFYLTADSANLEGDRLGYYIEIGESGSNDAFRVFRQDGGSRQELATGISGAVGSGIDGVVRVIRDDLGNWTLYSDLGSTGTFTEEASWTDATYLTSAFTGVRVRHTSSRNEAFFFDDL